VEFKSREKPQELKARLQTEEKKAEHELWKEKIILRIVLAGLSTITLACLVVALIPGPSEDKKWAMAILASIVSAGVGYLGGRASKPIVSAGVGYLGGRASKPD
jgi:hypothetical protein